MARTADVVRYVLLGAAILVVLLIALFLVLTRTEFGVQQAGRFAVERLRDAVEGELRVGRVASRGLLRGVTIHDVAIDDNDGRPFLRADSARLSYHLWTLIGGDLAFDRLTLYSPRVYVERLPGQEEWNVERIFPGDTAAVADTAADEDLALIEDATIHDGLVIIRFPWEPEVPVEPEDSARMILEEVPGGIARVLRFEDVHGRLPRVVWNAPGAEGRLIRVGGLAARAYIWETPLEVRRIEGTLTIRDSLYSFRAPRVQLPSSELSLVGRMLIGERGNRYDIQAEGDDVAFRDFQWLYPRLPEEGGGALRFRIQTQETGNTLWLAHEARLRAGETQVAGSFGVVTGDTLYFTNVDLRASPLDLELLQSLLPGELPLEGLLIGTVEVEGPISALRTRGDLRYRRMAAASQESAIRWGGTIQGQAPFRVTGMHADLRRLDLQHLARVAPGVRLRGIASGRVRADGSLRDRLRLDGELRLDRDGETSVVRGGGDLSVGDRSAFDLRLDAGPLRLDVLAEQFPALARLTGDASGPVTVRGSLEDLRVDADVVTPAGGLALHGRFALAGAHPRYRGEGAVTDFRLDRVIAGLPPTVITARFDADGGGARLEDLAGRIELELAAGEVAGVVVHGGTLRLNAAEGILHVDTAALSTRVGDLAGSGTLGLGPGRTGELRFSAVADSLSLLERLLLPEPALPDTTLFPPARLAGTVRVDGVARGSITDGLSVAGRAAVRNGVYEDIRARRAEVTAEWEPGSGHRLALLGSVDSLWAGPRILPHARLQGTHDSGVGELALEATGPGAQRLDLAGTYARIGGGARFHLQRLSLAGPDGEWLLADTVAGRIGTRGLALDDLLLTRERDGARIQMAGVLPWTEAGASGGEGARFTAAVERLRIGELLRLAQADTAVDGEIHGHMTVAGTALAPIIQGTVITRGLRYGDVALDSVAAEVDYQGRLLAGVVRGWRGGRSILEGEGEVPVDLALTDRAERRLDRPLRLRLRADSVPAALVAFLAPGFHRVSGSLDGALAIAGTPLDPTFEGELRLSNASGHFEHSAVTYRRVEANARVRDRELELVATLGTEKGAAQIRGTLALERPTDPGFDLELTARSFDASRRRDVVAVADGRVRLRGRYTRPIVSGAVRFTEGQLDVGEILRQYRIVQLEPWLYEVFDTTDLSFRPQQEPPFLSNLVVSNAVISVDRDFWIRGPELNVEVAGDLAVEYDRAAEDLRLTGILDAVRGTYQLTVARGIPARRFDIRDGTIEFIGTPGIDPNLAIAAQYRLRRAQGDPIDVVARVRGTLQSPRVSLTSESDLPISESDLASYVIFGRSYTELTQAESDVVTAQAGSGAWGQLGRQFGQGLWGLAMPTVYGLASSGLQLGLQSFLPVDYVAVSAADQDLGDFGALWRDAQLEVGMYTFRDLFLVGSVRVPRSHTGTGGFGVPKVGVRAEYRFDPTTLEFYIEDRFARTPSFGLEEIENRTVYGLTLFRDWRY